MSHVSLSFALLSLSCHIVVSQSSLSDRRPMFVLVFLFLVCRSVFLLLFSAEYHNDLMCFSLCGSHDIFKTFINPPALNPAFPRRDPRAQPGFSPPPYVPMDKPTVNTHMVTCHLANRYYTKFTTCTSGISGISDTAFCLAFSLFLTC